MFYIGQKVVCIDAKPQQRAGIHPELIYDKIYTVLCTENCRQCGSQLIDVGLPVKSGRQQMCCISIFDTVAHWVYAKRFIPLDEYTEMDKMVSELTETQKETV